MKRLLLALLVCLLAPAVAWAANIKQNEWGTTTWEYGSQSWPAGESGLTVEFEDLATAATDFVLTHKPGHIAKIYVIPDSGWADNSNNTLMDFGYSDGTTETFTPFDSTFEKLTMTTGTYATGIYASLVPTTTYSVTPGGVISIHSDGGGTAAGSTVKGTIIIVIE